MGCPRSRPLPRQRTRRLAGPRRATVGEAWSRADDLIARLVDRLTDGLVGEPVAPNDHASGRQIDIDGGHTRDLLDLLGYRHHAVPARHPLDGVFAVVGAAAFAE